MLVIAFPCRWGNYMLPMSCSSVLLRGWAPSEDQWTSEDKVSGTSCLLCFHICGLLSTQKLTETLLSCLCRVRYSAQQAFDVVPEADRGVQERECHWPDHLLEKWPCPVCHHPSLQAWPHVSDTCGAPWVGHLGSVRPARTPLTLCSPFCGCFLQGSAHHGQVWGWTEWAWVCFVSSVCPCLWFKMK